jgi:ketosteroid isomerase-like protein
MTRILRRCLVLLTLCAVLAPAAHARSDQDTQDDVKQFYAKLESVLNSDAYAKDPSVAFVFFDTANMRLYDAMLPEQIAGKDFAKHRFDVRAAYPANVTFSDMVIQGHDDLAFVSYVQRFVGQMKDGTPFDVRMPTTDGLVKAHGKWKIVHEHVAPQMDDATLSTVLSKSAVAPAP